MDRVRVVIVEDDPDWLRGLSNYIKLQPDLDIVGTAGSGQEAVQLLSTIEADVVLMDVMMSNSPEGLWATAEIAQAREGDVKIIMLSSMEEQDIIFDAFQAGAVDYMVKSDFTEIPDAIRNAYRNRIAIHPSVAEKMRLEFRRLKQLEQSARVKEMKMMLTPMELQVLGLIHKGNTQTQIADHFVISIRTVKIHVGNILRKLSSKSSKDAVQKAVDLGIL